ncbi:hypothetical protein [Clostridium saccharoperbutylacetonicum]
MKEYLTKVKELYEQHMDENQLVKLPQDEAIDFLAEELDLMIDFRLGNEKDNIDVEYLKTCQATMLNQKYKIDNEFINNTISAKEYAEIINNLMLEFIQKSANKIGKENFKKLFEFDPDNDIKIIDSNILENMGGI